MSANGSGADRRDCPRPGEPGAGGVLPAQTVLGLWRLDAPDAPPAWLADAAGRLIYENAAFRRIAAEQRERVASPDLGEVSAAVAALGRPLRRDEIVRIDGRLECFVSERLVVRDAAGAPVAVMGRLLPAGAIPGAAPALAEHRLDDVTRLVTDWIWETDAALRFTFVSQRVFDRLGYHPDELHGRSFAELGDDRPLREAGSGMRHRPLRDAAVEMRHRNGSRRAFLVSAVPIHDESGGFCGLRGTAHDITEREAQKAALLKAADDAESASRAKTEFLANMSHELRTPLNAVMGFAEIIAREVMGPVGNARYRVYAEDILASSRHLLKLINDILDIAKIEAGKLDLDDGVVAPAELIGEVVRLLAKQAERAEVRLLRDAAPDLPRLRCDERRLKQVLLNLVSNAVKFTPAGGTVTAQARRRADGGLAFVIDDTGIGIPSDQIDEAMAPFSQLDTGLARRFEGTGLGLPLSKALAELHGGSLEVESEPGVGTRVTVLLPPDRSVSAPPAEAKRAAG